MGSRDAGHALEGFQSVREHEPVSIGKRGHVVMELFEEDILSDGGEFGGEIGGGDLTNDIAGKVNFTDGVDRALGEVSAAKREVGGLA